MNIASHRAEKFLNEKNVVTDFLGKLEEKTGIKKKIIAAGTNWFWSILLNPLVVSTRICRIKAIESPSKEDDTKWLTYWVVYGVFSLGEFFSDIFLYWFPFYYAFKCLFLLWCMAPTAWNGSQFIYNKMVRPVFLRHEATVDNMVSDLSGKAMSAAEHLTREGTDGSLGGVVSQQLQASRRVTVTTNLCLLRPLVSPDHAGEEQICGDSGAGRHSV
uniref:Receptor expression-enhancing protein n=1 Tax=Scophthalmus maximus TaxID=52904 RepID=A0A8D3D5P7_SCOMX